MFLLSVIQCVIIVACRCFFVVLFIYNLVILSSDLLVFYMIIYYIYFDLKITKFGLKLYSFSKKEKWR